MDRGAWRVIVHGVAENQTRLKRLSSHALPLPGGLNLRRKEGRVHSILYLVGDFSASSAGSC